MPMIEKDLKKLLKLIQNYLESSSNKESRGKQTRHTAAQDTAFIGYFLQEFAKKVATDPIAYESLEAKLQKTTKGLKPDQVIAEFKLVLENEFASLNRAAGPLHSKTKLQTAPPVVFTFKDPKTPLQEHPEEPVKRESILKKRPDGSKRRGSPERQ